MKKKVAVSATETELSIDLTLHGFSVTLLREFAEEIVRPYYSGNINDAIKDLMRKAIGEEKFVLAHVELVKSDNNFIKNAKKDCG